MIRELKRFVFFLLIILAAGCGSEEKKGDTNNHVKPENYSIIINPSHGKTIRSGDDFKIELQITASPPEFKKAVFKLDGEEIYSSDDRSDNYNFSFNTSGLKMGLHVVSTELYFGNDEKEVNSVSILITSDFIPVKYTYMVRNKFRHDPTAYTQGLEIRAGQLYEGTGLNGKSEIRLVDLFTGNVLKSKKLGAEFFGEGITIVDDKIYQITYQSNKGFVYDRNTFEKIQEFTYATEGWGLTHNENYLIMSDGTNKLYFLDKETFERKDEIEVYDNVGPVNMINELEYIKGEIWANVYLSQEIIRINPATGKVTGRINMAGIFDPNSVSYKTDVLNGIAYDKIADKIYVTGKLWPNLYEVEFLNAE